ncbi:hypothetical protein IPC347_15490 [Pseudomonas aeruginosa]|nr:hypothetical protein IPC347_15490 [Pseudomonas aeruginosa]
MGHHQSLPRVCAHVPLLLDGNRAFRAPVWARGALRWAVPSESLPGIPGAQRARLMVRSLPPATRTLR